MKSAFFLDKTNCPVSSSNRSRYTSMVSPTIGRSPELKSSIGTIPSDLNPISTIASLSLTANTLPSVTSPSDMSRSELLYKFSISLSLEVNSNVIDSSSSTETVFISSLTMGGLSGAIGSSSEVTKSLISPSSDSSSFFSFRLFSPSESVVSADWASSALSSDLVSVSFSETSIVAVSSACSVGAFSSSSA